MKPKATKQQQEITDSLIGVEQGATIVIIANPLPGSNKPNIIEGQFHKFERIDKAFSKNRSIFIKQEREGKEVNITINESLVRSIRAKQQLVNTL